MWRGDIDTNRPSDTAALAKICDMLDIEYWQMADGTQIPIALEHGWETAGGMWKDRGQCLRNRNKTKAMPVGANPQTTYAIFHGKYVNGGCCFNYGNTGKAIHYTGPGTLSALTFSKMTFWSKGQQSGPWPMVDWETGVYTGNTGKCGSGIPAGTECSSTGENPVAPVLHDIVTVVFQTRRQQALGPQDRQRQERRPHGQRGSSDVAQGLFSSQARGRSWFGRRRRGRLRWLGRLLRGCCYRG